MFGETEFWSSSDCNVADVNAIVVLKLLDDSDLDVVAGTENGVRALELDDAAPAPLLDLMAASIKLALMMSRILSSKDGSDLFGETEFCASLVRCSACLLAASETTRTSESDFEWLLVWRDELFWSKSSRWVPFLLHVVFLDAVFLEVFVSCAGVIVGGCCCGLWG